MYGRTIKQEGVILREMIYKVDFVKDHFVRMLKDEARNYKNPYLSFYLELKKEYFILVPIFKISMNAFVSRPIPLYPYPIFKGCFIENDKLIVKIDHRMSPMMRIGLTILVVALFFNFLGGGFKGLQETFTQEGWFVLPSILFIVTFIYHGKKNATQRFLDRVFSKIKKKDYLV